MTNASAEVKIMTTSEQESVGIKKAVEQEAAHWALF